MSRKGGTGIVTEVSQFILNFMGAILFAVIGMGMVGGTLTIPLFGFATVYFGWVFLIMALFGVALSILRFATGLSNIK